MGFSAFSLFFFFETGSHCVALVGLELYVEQTGQIHREICLLSVGTEGVYHNVWIIISVCMCTHMHTYALWCRCGGQRTTYGVDSHSTMCSQDPA